MTNCEILAFHGWGFGSQYWRPWKEALSQLGTFQAYNRGYFKAPDSTPSLPDTNRKTILIAHSFGLHLIEESFLKQADLLIILGGFLRFHPVSAQYQRRSRTVLQQMINEFEVHPEKVLRNFYANCFAPKEAENIEMDELNHQLLLDDLEQIGRSALEPEKLKEANRICIIHGADDHIVPKSKGREIFNQLPIIARYFEIKGAGHAIPITHAEQCLEFINPEIELMVDKVDQL